MLVRTAYGSRIVRRTPAGVAEWGNTNPWRFRMQSFSSPSGIQVTDERVFGLASVVEGLRLASEAVACYQWGVWDVSMDGLPRIDKEAWQSELIALPQLTNRFNLFQDTSASIDGHGNAFINKVKANGRVVALQVIDPNRVKVNVEGGRVTYDVAISTSEIRKGLTSDDILHIRGFQTAGFVSGFSLPARFSYELGNILALQEFTGNWWKNSGTASQVIEHPDDINDRQAEQILAIWEETHGGIENAGRPALLTGGAKLNTITITAEDAQLINSREWSVEEIARMVHVPTELLGGASDTKSSMAKTEEVLRRWTTLYIAPRAERIAAAFNDDPDLFGGTTYALIPKHDPTKQADTQFIGQYDMQARQSFIETINEIRARRGLAPSDDPRANDLFSAVPAGAPGADKQPDPAASEEQK